MVKGYIVNAWISNRNGDQNISSLDKSQVWHQSVLYFLISLISLVFFIFFIRIPKFWTRVLKVSESRPLAFLLYISDIKHAIGCDDVKLFAEDTFLFMNDRNIDVIKEKTSDLFDEKFRWCVAHQLSINIEKTNFVLFNAKNKSIPENLDCIHATYLTIDRDKCVQYLMLRISMSLRQLVK